MGTAHHLEGMRQEKPHGWFGGGLGPVLRVEPGDSVVYWTPDAMWDREGPASATENVSRLARPEGAGHALAGPVWVEGAQPGDVLVVRVRELLTRDWGIAGHRPGKRAISGVLAGKPDDVRDEYLVRLSLDRGRGVWRFGERVEVPLAPFMGVLGVAPGSPGRTPTLRPGPHGGNMDCKELGIGATVYLPVHVPGAMFSVGDGHGARGDGEVDGAAIETGMERW